MLINLTNHPSSFWQDKQRLAASAYGRVVDMPFPAVDPHADEAEVGHLADQYLSDISSQWGLTSDIVVHIMGEMTFTLALVRRLRERGVSCVASTTRRIVEPTGDNERKVTFEFVRFRKYE